MQVHILASGSSGNAIVVATNKTAVVIDMGLGPRQFAARLKQTSIMASHIQGCLLTHEHSDHVRGLRNTIAKLGIPIYCNAPTWKSLLPTNPLYHALPYRELAVGGQVTIGDIDVESFSITHDAVQPVGYCLYHGGKKIVIATDLGVATGTVVNALQDADEIVLESNHDPDLLKRGPYPIFLKRRVASEHGHLSNIDAARTLEQVICSKTKRIHLAHLSQENNHPELALRTVKQHLHGVGLPIGQVEIKVAPPLAPRKEQAALDCRGQSLYQPVAGKGQLVL